MANERDVLYRLQLDNKGVLDGIDAIISRFEAMEQAGGRAIEKLSSQMGSLGAVSKQAASSQSEILKATTALDQATESSNKSTEKALTDKQQMAALNAQVAEALKSESAAIAAAIEEEAQARKRVQLETDLQKRQLREVSVELSRNKSEIYQLIKLFPGAEQGIRAIVDKYGTFTVTLGTNRKALSDEEQQVRDLIASYPQLAREIQRVADTTRLGQQNGISIQATPTKFRSEQESSFLTPFQIRQVGQAIDQLGLRGAGTASQLLSVFGPVGLAFAGLALGVKAVITKLIELAKAGAEAFASLVKESVGFAGELDSIKASFSAIFENQDAGADVVKRIRLESEKLGVDLDEIVRKSLPFVKSIDQALKLGEFAVGLGQLDPKQGTKGATRVLQDALVGNLTSLRKTFAINVDDIRKAQEELGNAEGLLVGLEQVLKDRGLDFEALENTWAVSSGRMVQLVQTLKAQLGEPIVDSLISNFNELFKLSQDKRDEMLTVANAIGEGVAKIADTVLGFVQRLLDSLDSADFLQIANDVSAIAVSIDALIGSFTSFSPDSNPLLAIMDELASGIQNVTENLIIMKHIANGVLTTIKDNANEVGAILTGFASGGFIGASMAASIEKDASVVDNVTEELRLAAAEIVALREGIDEAAKSNEEFANSIGDVNQRLKDLEDARLAVNFDTDAADTALQDLTDYQEEAQKVYDKHDDDIAKAERQLGDEIEDAAKKRSRDLIDLEEEASNKRIDAAKDNARALADIFRKNSQAIRDAYTDGSDKEADILRKNARKVQEIEEESTKERIKIERDFQDELAKMRRKYEFDKSEAIRSNDAIEFLRIKRRYEFELKEANISHEKETSDTEAAIEDKREKQRLQLEQEIEDAQIVNQRKLRDLQTRLNDELEAQRIKHQRELEDIAVFEARKAAEIDKAFKRSNEDIQTSFDRRIREIEAGYEREIALVRAKEAELTAVLNQAKAAQTASMAAYNAAVAATGGLIGGRRGSSGGRSGRPGARPANVPSVDTPTFLGQGGTSGLPIPEGGAGLTGRAGGGFIPAHRTVMVGEPVGGKPNPEVITPTSDSMAIPLRKLMFSPPRSYNSFDNSGGSSKAEITIDMLDPTKVSPEVLYQIKQLIVETVSKGLERARYGQ